MAFERQDQTMIIDLEQLVSIRITNLNKIKTQIRVREEMAYQSNILQSDIPLEEQLNYRRDLIEKEQAKGIPDHDFIASLKADKSLLHKQIRTKNYRDIYQASLNDYKAKRTSADSHLQFLSDALVGLNDVALRQEIMTNIGDMEGLIVQKHQNAVLFQITNALEDKTFGVLNDALTLAKKERNKARLIADVDTAAMYDVKITVLEREHRVATLTSELNKIDLDVTGGKGIDAKLDWIIKKKAEGATGLGADPFSFGGVQYNNQQDFWNEYFTNFIGGEYFAAKETELKNKTTSWYNQFGDISKENMDWIKNEANKVFDRPELAPWKDTLGKAFQQSVLMSALDYKMSVLQEELQLSDTPKGLATVNQKVMDLQASIPEISQHTAFNNLSVAYATKQREMLQTKLQTFIDSKSDELSLLTSSLSERSDISEEDRNKAKNTIADMQSKLGLMGTNINFTNIPLEQFTFGKDVNSIYDALVQPYSSLIGATKLEGLEFEQWVDTAIQGFAQQRGVPIPGPGTSAPGTPTGNVPATPAAPAPPPVQTAPSTPTVSGSSKFESELGIFGDEGKKQTMAGWGYQWQWSDQANQIGGWTPTSEAAKSKFKQLYGTDFTGKKATLQKGESKVISFADSPFSKGLMDQGYQLI